jgi:hypothetical protein
MPFVYLGLALETKKKGKLSGGRWVTDHNHRHLYLRGGRVVAGRGVQAGATWHKPAPGAGGPGGGAAKPAASAKPRTLDEAIAHGGNHAPVAPAKPTPAPPKPTPAPPKPATKPAATAPAKPKTLDEIIAEHNRPTAAPAKPAAAPAKPIAPAKPGEAPKPEPTKPAAPSGPVRDHNRIEDFNPATATQGQKDEHYAREKVHQANREQHFKEEFGAWEGTRSEKEKKALRYYKSDKGYTAINADLRAGKANRQAEVLDGALARHSLSQDTALYRGIRDLGGLGIPTGHAAVGYTHHDRAFQSTSLDRKVAAGFAGRGAADPTKHNAVLRIVARKGAHVGGVGTDPDHKFGHEKEVLIGRGSSVKITKYHGLVDGKHLYDAELQ